MTLRLIAILLVVIIIVAIFYADPIYNWFKNLFKKDEKNEKGEEK